MAVGLPYWLSLTFFSSFFALRVVLAFIVCMLGIALTTSLIIAIIDGWLRLVLAAAVVGLLIGIVPGLVPLSMSLFLTLWLMLVVSPIVLGILVHRGWKAGRAFGLASVLMAVFLAIIYMQIGGVVVEMINHAADTLEKVIAGPFGDAYSRDQANRTIDGMLYLVRILTRLLPGFMIMAGISLLLLAFMVAEWYFTRRDSYFPGFGPFIYWKVPEKVLYFLGVVLIARLTIDGNVRLAADNIIFVLLILYAVCGTALAEYALRRLRMPVMIRAVFYIGLGLMHIIGLVAASVAGLFDSYFDFRRVRAHTLG